MTAECYTFISRTGGVTWPHRVYLVGGFTLSDLLDKPWSQVSSLSPPRSLLSRIGFSILTARRFHRMLLTHALALYANQFLYDKNKKCLRVCTRETRTLEIDLGAHSDHHLLPSPRGRRLMCYCCGSYSATAVLLLLCYCSAAAAATCSCCVVLPLLLLLVTHSPSRSRSA